MRPFWFVVLILNSSVPVSLLYGKGLELGKAGRERCLIRCGEGCPGLSLGCTGEVKGRGRGQPAQSRTEVGVEQEGGGLNGISPGDYELPLSAGGTTGPLPGEGQDRITLVVTGRTDLSIVPV